MNCKHLTNISVRIARRYCKKPSETVTSNVSDQKYSSSKEPTAPDPEECCATGCSDCVYLKYAENLVDYYRDGGEKAREAIEQIPNQAVKTFVKFELKQIIEMDSYFRDRQEKLGNSETKDNN